MATNFDDLLAERTRKGAATMHGAIMKCVDKHGNEIYSKLAGHTSVHPAAAPLPSDAVFKLGSATKLITTIALLQCVDAGLLTLDEPITRILPELAHLPILTPAGDPATRPSTTPITARHLLTHTSGLGYVFTHPLLAAWRTAHPTTSRKLTERLTYPLVFNPGEGWLYGCSLDWAGVAVRRLHGDISLEAYMNTHIWARLGREEPFPTFHVEEHPAYAGRLMQTAERVPAGDGGGLRHAEGMAFCAHLDDDEGGAGLACTVGDYLAVVGDLVAGEPKLLRRETVQAMFAPQLSPAAMPGLLALRPVWDMVAGPGVLDSAVSHGLGGLLVVVVEEEEDQGGSGLCWAGSPNFVWFACRERGVAGVFATQIAPFGDAGVREVVDAWRRDFWDTVHREG